MLPINECEIPATNNAAACFKETRPDGVALLPAEPGSDQVCFMTTSPGGINPGTTGERYSRCITLLGDQDDIDTARNVDRYGGGDLLITTREQHVDHLI